MKAEFREQKFRKSAKTDAWLAASFRRLHRLIFSMNLLAADVSQLTLFLRKIKADSHRLLRFRVSMREITFGRTLIRALLAISTSIAPLWAAESGSSVVVVYNSTMPESKQVAEHYAQRRQVPASQVFGFELPATESMTRLEFLEQLQKPLLKNLQANKLFTVSATSRQPVDASIRYAVLCYGVPTKILRDPTLVEPQADKLPVELRRSEAAVDSQLACLPLPQEKQLWIGPLMNPGYLATNAHFLHPTNGILLVARLDGPTSSIARGLVDKAMEAETNGLWGRAYFDARGVTNNEYRLGDEWIRAAANVTRRMGFDTELDENPGTFPASFPMSQIAFYAGWYDASVSGPFTRPTVEFMPGAFAYHLHSFSAQTLRSATQNWVGPLLSKGATITLGCVDEPYLTGTPNIAAFMERFLFGFSFGEAACAGQIWLSWQTTVVGDPLYRPFGRRGDEQHFDLQKRQSPLVEWSHLRVVGMNQALGTSTGELIDYLEKIPATKRSAVLKEKLADLYWAKKQFSDGLDTYEEVLKLEPTPQQRIRVMLGLAQKRSVFGPQLAAFELYEKFLHDFPDYPDHIMIFQKLLPLALKLGKKEEAERCQQEIKRLTTGSVKS